MSLQQQVNEKIIEAKLKMYRGMLFGILSAAGQDGVLVRVDTNYNLNTRQFEMKSDVRPNRFSPEPVSEDDPIWQEADDSEEVVPFEFTGHPGLPPEVEVDKPTVDMNIELKKPIYAEQEQRQLTTNAWLSNVANELVCCPGRSHDLEFILYQEGRRKVTVTDLNRTVIINYLRSGEWGPQQYEIIDVTIKPSELAATVEVNDAQASTVTKQEENGKKVRFSDMVKKADAMFEPRPVTDANVSLEAGTVLAINTERRLAAFVATATLLQNSEKWKHNVVMKLSNGFTQQLEVDDSNRRAVANALRLGEYYGDPILEFEIENSTPPSADDIKALTADEPKMRFIEQEQTSTTNISLGMIQITDRIRNELRSGLITKLQLHLSNGQSPVYEITRQSLGGILNGLSGTGWRGTPIVGFALNDVEMKLEDIVTAPVATPSQGQQPLNIADTYADMVLTSPGISLRLRLANGHFIDVHTNPSNAAGIAEKLRSGHWEDGQGGKTPIVAFDASARVEHYNAPPEVKTPEQQAVIEDIDVPKPGEELANKVLDTSSGILHLRLANGHDVTIRIDLENQFTIAGEVMNGTWAGAQIIAWRMEEFSATATTTNFNDFAALTSRGGSKLVTPSCLVKPFRLFDALAVIQDFSTGTTIAVTKAGHPEEQYLMDKLQNETLIPKLRSGCLPDSLGNRKIIENFRIMFSPDDSYAIKELQTRTNAPVRWVLVSTSTHYPGTVITAQIDEIYVFPFGTRLNVTLENDTVLDFVVSQHNESDLRTKRCYGKAIKSYKVVEYQRPINTNS